jgi:cation diffusion facilitator CzcD-associated flavoprotein CzcO
LDVDVAIVGAGVTGLYMANHLRKTGRRFVVFEKAHEVGGTWLYNRYPGLFVDVPTSKYQLSFAPKFDWSHVFAPGPEIQEYLVAVSNDYGLRPHIRLGTEVLEAEWLGDAWRLTTDVGLEVTAAAVVFATGILHQPKLPGIDGMDSFAGPWFHSSQWPDDLDVDGKRVGIVGTGSSGIQLVAELAYHDCEVTQFVRTPQWVEIIDNPATPEELVVEVRKDPVSAPPRVEEFEKTMNQDPRLTNLAWKIEPGPLRDEASKVFYENLNTIEDPVLRAALTPGYPPGCKRIPKSKRYYEAVQRPNVHVVAGGIARVEPGGVVSPDGALHELDVLVYATGFDAHAYMRPIRVVGDKGKLLDSAWSEGPYSFRGITVPDFPNMLVLHGPFSPVNVVPPPIVLDDQIAYLDRLIQLICDDGVAISPTFAATEQFSGAVSDAIPQTVWAAGCDNWYRGGPGTPLIWPWLAADHTALFTNFSLDDFQVTPLSTRRSEGQAGQHAMAEQAAQAAGGLDGRGDGDTPIRSETINLTRDMH